MIFEVIIFHIVSNRHFFIDQCFLASTWWSFWFFCFVTMDKRVYIFVIFNWYLGAGMVEYSRLLILLVFITHAEPLFILDDCHFQLLHFQLLLFLWISFSLCGSSRHTFFDINIFTYWCFLGMILADLLDYSPKIITNLTLRFAGGMTIIWLNIWILYLNKGAAIVSVEMLLLQFWNLSIIWGCLQNI